MSRRMLIVLVLAALALAGCAIHVDTFRDYDTPLHEAVLEEGGPGKVALIPVQGVISTSPREGLVSRAPSQVQEVVSHLNRAAEDPEVKAVVLQIDSPGGTVVASEILYSEIMRWKQKTGGKVVALQMGVAASGGYMASLAGDRIVAHASTVTGSVGTLFIQLGLSGLMDKIGVTAEAVKSGEHKDMGSPLRQTTPEERALLQAMIDEMNGRFLALVRQRRGLDPEALGTVADARVLTASQAKALGLIDRIGTAHDAVDEAASLAGLAEPPTVVAYRRTEFAEDNLYNTATSGYQGRSPALVDLGLPTLPGAEATGFCHLWLPELD